MGGGGFILIFLIVIILILLALWAFSGQGLLTGVGAPAAGASPCAASCGPFGGAIAIVLIIFIFIILAAAAFMWSRDGRDGLRA